MSVERHQAWEELSRRHLEMSRLLVDSHPDGAFFHAYHAFECAISARILELAPEESLPSGHADKIDLFLDLVRDEDLARRVATLRPHLDRRNEALYVGWRGDRVRKPSDLFKVPAVRAAMRRVEALLDHLLPPLPPGSTGRGG